MNQKYLITHSKYTSHLKFTFFKPTSSIALLVKFLDNKVTSPSLKINDYGLTIRNGCHIVTSGNVCSQAYGRPRQNLKQSILICENIEKCEIANVKLQKCENVKLHIID